MKVTKRTYQKHKTDKKITVKHYLNTRLKPVVNSKSLLDGKDRYPVYLRLAVLGKTFDMKSKINFPVALDEFDLILTVEKDIFYKEILFVTEIIEQAKPFDNTFFTLKSVANKYHFLSISLQEAVDNILSEKICQLLEVSLKYDENETLKELEWRSPELFLKFDKSHIAKTQKDFHNFILDGIFKKKLNFKKTNSFFCLQTIITHSLNSYIDENVDENNCFSNTLLEDMQKYEDLYNQYNHIWMFWAAYYNTILEKSRMTKLTPKDWISSTFLQQIILDTYPKFGQELINQMNDLFNLQT